MAALLKGRYDRVRKVKHDISTALNSLNLLPNASFVLEKIRKTVLQRKKE